MMLWRSLLTGAVLLVAAGPVRGQTTAGGTEGTWQRSGQRTFGTGSVTPAARTATPAAIRPVESVTPMARHLAKVTVGSGTLPNQHGQLWREYDISPYTLRVTSTNRPEQSIVDWILRETGYEAWHAEPLGILTATPRKLLVYHTPEMQELVANVVDRFISSEAEVHRFGLRVVTVKHPNWRAKVQSLLQPVQVQTAGVEAWLLEKEEASVLLADIQRRAGYR